jgi:hypothetical protein
VGDYLIRDLNPLEQYIKEYYYNLNIIKGYLYQMKNRIESHKKRLTDFYDKNGIDINNLFTGTAIAFSDLSEWPEDGWRKNYISGAFSKRGEDYLVFTEKLIEREAALSIALGYETLETFLKRISSTFILHNEEFVNEQKYQKFKERYKYNSTSDLDYWNEYLKLSYKGKNNKYLLKFIREVSPQFEKLEKENNRILNLTEWFEVSSIVRHSIIHSNSTIKYQDFSGFTSTQMNILNEYFPGKVENDRFAISFNEKSANIQLVRLAEYGFLVFKCLSIAGNYKWDIFQMGKDE